MTVYSVELPHNSRFTDVGCGFRFEINTFEIARDSEIYSVENAEIEVIGEECGDEYEYRTMSVHGSMKDELIVSINDVSEEHLTGRDRESYEEVVSKKVEIKSVRDIEIVVSNLLVNYYEVDDGTDLLDEIER